MQKNKIISKETVYKSKFFHLEKRDIEIKGKVITKDFVVRDSIVLIIPITEDNNIYLARQYRDALGGESVELFAGHLDKGENPLDGAKRELKEESGLTAKNWHHLIDLNLSSNMVARVHVFVAMDLTEGNPDQDIDEDIEVLKVPLSEAINKIKNGEINASSHVAALLYFEKSREKI